MGKYTVRRCLLFIPTLFVAMLLVFTLMRIVPGDPALLVLAGNDADALTIDPRDLAALRAKLGLDRPLIIQLADYYGDAVRGDFGVSLYTRQPILQTILKRFPLSLELAIMAIVITTVTGIPAGVLSAKYQDGWADHIIRVVSVTGLAIPSFWAAILLIMALVFLFSWIPPTVEYHQLWENPWLNLQQLLLPAMLVGLTSTAWITRLTRSMMLEVIREDYIRTARAKGLGERAVLYRHSLKNALLPVITSLGTQVSIAFGGLVIIERIFNLPGIGLLFINAIGRRDYPTVQAVVTFITFGVLLLNLITDLTYAWIDPRIKYG